MKLLLSITLFLPLISWAGGVETKPGIGLYNSYAPADVAPYEMKLQFNGAVVEAERFNKFANDGGVETWTIEAIEALKVDSMAQLVSRIGAKIEPMTEVDSIKFESETPTSVFIEINGGSAIVEVRDTEIQKSPYVEAMINRAAQTDEWIKLR
jgi:hypothetical protein